MQNNAKHKMCDFILYAKISECWVSSHTHTHIKFPILPLCGLSLCYGHKIEMENEMAKKGDVWSSEMTWMNLHEILAKLFKKICTFGEQLRISGKT